MILIKATIHLVRALIVNRRHVLLAVLVNRAKKELHKLNKINSNNRILKINNNKEVYIKVKYILLIIQLV